MDSSARPSILDGPAGLAGLAVACVAMCWGLPLLLAAGSAVTILGLGLRSWALITAGAVIAVVATAVILRRRTIRRSASAQDEA